MCFEHRPIVLRPGTPHLVVTVSSPGLVLTESRVLCPGCREESLESTDEREQGLCFSCQAEAARFIEPPPNFHVEAPGVRGTSTFSTDVFAHDVHEARHLGMRLARGCGYQPAFVNATPITHTLSA